MFFCIFVSCIQAIAVGNTWAAVATNHNNLHLFTLAGIQTNTMCLSGAVVSMSGHDNQLIVVYHCGVGAPGYQCLGVKLIDVNSNTQNNTFVVGVRTCIY